MINKEVIPAFEMLLEELERIIPELNARGKQLLDEKKYPQARELINKAETVVAFQAKVKALRDEWLRMDVPQTQAPKPAKPGKRITRTNLGKLQEGLRTKNEAFHMPILQALVDRGGSAKFGEVIAALTHDMADTLNAYDWEKLPDGKSIRWQNSVGWTKMALRDLGYLSGVSPRGIWEITPLGRQALLESKQVFK